MVSNAHKLAQGVKLRSLVGIVLNCVCALLVCQLMASLDAFAIARVLPISRDLPDI